MPSGNFGSSLCPSMSFLCSLQMQLTPNAMQQSLFPISNHSFLTQFLLIQIHQFLLLPWSFHATFLLFKVLTISTPHPSPLTIFPSLLILDEPLQQVAISMTLSLHCTLWLKMSLYVASLLASKLLALVMSTGRSLTNKTSP